MCPAEYLAATHLWACHKIATAVLSWWQTKSSSSLSFYCENEEKSAGNRYSSLLFSQAIFLGARRLFRPARILSQTALRGSLRGGLRATQTFGHSRAGAWADYRLTLSDYELIQTFNQFSVRWLGKKSHRAPTATTKLEAKSTQSFKERHSSNRCFSVRLSSQDRAVSLAETKPSIWI